MSKHRLHVEGPIEPGKTLEIRGEQARYMSRVLRLRPDDEVTLFDGSGCEFPAWIRKPGKNIVAAEVGEAVDRSVESPLSVTLLQGISRGDRMDYVIQKATELGVTRVTPVHTEFSVVKLDQERAARRLRHWQGVAASACEQCGRNRLPCIDSPESLPNVLGRLRESPDDRIILQPGAPETVRSIGIAGSALHVLIGPEGGFSQQEQEHAGIAGFRPVGFGPRILRTETAAVAVLAALQSMYGDCG